MENFEPKYRPDFQHRLEAILKGKWVKGITFEEKGGWKALAEYYKGYINHLEFRLERAESISEPIIKKARNWDRYVFHKNQDPRDIKWRRKYKQLQESLVNERVKAYEAGRAGIDYNFTEGKIEY